MDIHKHQPKTFALFAAFLTAAILSAPLAYAEDAAATDAVQALTDALADASSDSPDDIPEFESRKERRAYFEKLRAEDPEKFKALMKEKREKWAKNHPEADYRENRRDRREDRWDARHDGGKRDRMEDRRDRREDRWDAHHGPDRGKPGRPYRKHDQDRY